MGGGRVERGVGGNLRGWGEGVIMEGEGKGALWKVKGRGYGERRAEKRVDRNLRG